MKKHIEVGNKLINLDKRWSDLKCLQKEWISIRLQTSYLNLASVKERIPTHLENEMMLEKVYEEIEEKGIWIPYEEVRDYFKGKIRRYNEKIKKNNI